jgi:RNA polymerase sigma-70 factor, ECF subfamily
MESEHEAGVTRPQPGAGSMRAIASAPGDAELVSRIAAGDEAALAYVYDRHAHIVYGSVMRLLHDREAAEEVVQDVYLAVWRNAGQYSPTAGSLLSWVLGIARNKAIDRVRAAARRPRLVVVGDPDDDRDEVLERAMSNGWPVRSLGEGDLGPEEAATRAWAGAVVRTALSAMPAHERQAIRLAYDEGLTQTEIAERLGWPLGTVKTRTRRALSTLRAALESVPDLGDDMGRAAARLRAAAGAQARVLGGSDATR